MVFTSLLISFKVSNRGSKPIAQRLMLGKRVERVGGIDAGSFGLGVSQSFGRQSFPFGVGYIVLSLDETS